MAKARHVGMPHFLQFVFGNSLKICNPVIAIIFFLFTVVNNPFHFPVIYSSLLFPTYWKALANREFFF